VERYRVVGRQAVVALIEQAVEASGGRVIERPDPSSAPFLLKAAGPDGRILDLVCYAFTANKYRQLGRPADEHRFQVKYGSEFDRYHHLYLDPKGTRITLMFGVHLELGLFVGVDPRIHTPTWFSSSVEMKEADLDDAKAKGWHGWQRDRSSARRKRIMPEEDLRSEAVIGFRPKHFLKYAEMESVAIGLDPGERLLLSDRIEAQVRAGQLVNPLHTLEAQLGLSAREILDVIGAHFRLKAAVRGSVAEHHLGRYLQHIPGISGVRHVDEDGRPDFEVNYKKRSVRIECKNILGRPAKDGPRVDFQKTRASKNNPCSRYYEPSQFEVLAACLHPLTQQWEFRFSGTSTLKPHPRCPGRLSDRVVVGGPTWMDDLPNLLDSLTA
jgi:hypothetical protein